MIKRTHQLRRGMTLVELLVAIGIVSIIILAVGYIFTKTGEAMNLTNATIDINSNIRAATGQIRDDVRSINKDGFLCIVSGVYDADGVLQNPPLLMFTSTGNYQSQTNPNVRANAAVILYMPINDGHSLAPVNVFGRYAYLLTGNPVNYPRPFIVHPVLPDGEDILGSDLRLIQVTATDPDPFLNLISPLTAQITEIDCAPDSMDGLQELWPYMIGGCLDMTVEIMDAVDGQWYEVDNVPDRPGITKRVMPSGAAACLWSGFNNSNWPKAIRLTLTMQDIGGRVASPQTYEIILNLPE